MRRGQVCDIGLVNSNSTLTILDTVLAYKQRNKVGRFAEKSEVEPTEEAVDENIRVGARCEVESSEEDLKKRGTIRFVGSTKFGKGAWVGIEYDEPLGKNDGSYVSWLLFADSCKD